MCCVSPASRMVNGTSEHVLVAGRDVLVVALFLGTLLHSPRRCRRYRVVCEGEDRGRIWGWEEACREQ